MRIALFGPPGTGKTKTTIDMLSESGQSALFLSYSKAAATEAASRIEDGSKVKPSTIHALAFQTLGMTRASVVDKKKLVDFSDETGIPFKGEDGSDEAQEGDEYVSVLSYANNKKMGHEEAYNHFARPGTLLRFEYFLESYRKWKTAYGYWDFDDMLKRSLDPAIQFEVPHTVAIDEAQDCSPLQWDVIRKICKSAKDVLIAGDDDQAIHEWNGADPHGMIDFIEGEKGEIRILDQSYRVPRSVLAFAKNHTTSMISKRVEKIFNPRPADGKITRYGSVFDINFPMLYKKGGGMMLARDRWQLDDIRKAINRDMVPYAGLGISSPWTSRIAQMLRKGEKPDIPIQWMDFYRQADLSLPINITLSTIHQAKGKESHRVIVDLTLPTRALASLYNDRDAELRVMYVALTRTSDSLILCSENPLI